MIAAVAGILAADAVVFLRPQYVSDARLPEARQIVYSGDGRRFIAIFYDEPVMSFGSGHVVLRLYNSAKRLLAEATYGEIPITITSWSAAGLDVEVEIRDGYREYAQDWIRRNSSIDGIKLRHMLVRR